MIRRLLVSAVGCGVLAFAAPQAFGDTLSQTECAWDNSYTYHVCVTQNYTTGSNHGRATVSIQNYQVAFTGGASGVSIRGATALAGVQGVGTRSHHLYLSETQQWNIGTPRMHHTYTFVPRWHGDPIIITHGGPHIYQCGRADATVRHGGSHWHLSTPNACQGSL
jgi:hypothetical protein